MARPQPQPQRCCCHTRRAGDLRGSPSPGFWIENIYPRLSDPRLGEAARTGCLAQHSPEGSQAEGEGENVLQFGLGSQTAPAQAGDAGHSSALLRGAAVGPGQAKPSPLPGIQEAQPPPRDGASMGVLPQLEMGHLQLPKSFPQAKPPLLGVCNMTEEGRTPPHLLQLDTRPKGRAGSCPRELCALAVQEFWTLPFSGSLPWVVG